jgi:hypothetical protein
MSILLTQDHWRALAEWLGPFVDKFLEFIAAKKIILTQREHKLACNVLVTMCDITVPIKDDYADPLLWNLIPNDMCVVFLQSEAEPLKMKVISGFKAAVSNASQLKNISVIHPEENNMRVSFIPLHGGTQFQYSFTAYAGKYFMIVGSHKDYIVVEVRGSQHLIEMNLKGYDVLYARTVAVAACIPIYSQTKDSEVILSLLSFCSQNYVLIGEYIPCTEGIIKPDAHHPPHKKAHQDCLNFHSIINTTPLAAIIQNTCEPNRVKGIFDTLRLPCTVHRSCDVPTFVRILNELASAKVHDTVVYTDPAYAKKHNYDLGYQGYLFHFSEIIANGDSLQIGTMTINTIWYDLWKTLVQCMLMDANVDTVDNELFASIERYPHQECSLAEAETYAEELVSFYQYICVQTQLKRPGMTRPQDFVRVLQSVKKIYYMSGDVERRVTKEDDDF